MHENPLFVDLQSEQFVVRDLHESFLIDSLSTSHPIYVPVQHPDEINEIFDKISYLKVSIQHVYSVYST